MPDVLDVDLLAFERGDAAGRAAVVDGVMRSLGTGFVFTSHDLPAALLDEVYERLAAFFALPAAEKAAFHRPESHGQTGYTGLLVETAATAELADWKEMLNWGAPVAVDATRRERYPHRYLDPVLPDALRAPLLALHDALAELQTRFLRIIAVGLGKTEGFFDDMVADGPHLSRAIHYPSMAEAPNHDYVWADSHTDINLITALPRATGRGLQLTTADGWADVVPPEGHVVINSGIMLERVSEGRIPAGRHRVVAPAGSTDDRISVVQFCHPAPWVELAPGVEAGALLDQVLREIRLLD